MGNRVEKNMSVGVTANVAQFNKAMSDMRRHIGFAQKATTEANDYMRAFADATEKERLTAEQTAITMGRLTLQLEKQAIATRAAIQANIGWEAGLRKVNTTLLAQEAAAKRAGKAAFEAGLAAMQANRMMQANAGAYGLGSYGGSSGSGSGSPSIDPILGAGRPQPVRPSDGYNIFGSGVNVPSGGPSVQDVWTGRDAMAASYMQQFQTPREQMASQLKEAKGLFDSGVLSATQYARAVGEINKQHSVAHRSFSMMKEAITTMVGPLVLAYQAYDFLLDSIRKTAEFELASAKFEVFLGNATDAANMLAEIRQLSRESPVSFEGSQRAATTMLQFGVATKEVLPSLKAIAEITGGDQMRMEALALAFAQTQAAGRLMGQELLQMVNAGFNPLKLMSEQTGISLVDLKRQMEDGGVSAQEVMQLFKDAVAEGGQFAGLFEKMGDTTHGAMTRAKSAVDELKIAIGGLLDLKDRLDQFAMAAGGLARLLGGDVSGVGGMAYASAMTNAGISGGASSAVKGMKFLNDPNDVAMREYIAAANAAKSTEDLLKAQIEYVRAVGESNLSQPFVEMSEGAQATLDSMALLERQNDAILEQFKDAIADQKRQFIGNVYGDRASIVELLLGSAGSDTGKMNDLIKQKAPYEQILALASETAQQEAKRLELMMKTNDEFKTQEENQKKASKAAQDEMEAVLDNIDDQRAAHKKMRDAFESDARSIGQRYNPSDRLARLMAMQSMGLISDADFNQERASLLSDSNAAARSVSAPSAVQAGSAEVVSILANLQVQAVSEQQRLADRAAKFQKITADATAGMFKILDEIRDDLVTGNAP